VNWIVGLGAREAGTSPPGSKTEVAAKISCWVSEVLTKSDPSELLALGRRLGVVDAVVAGFPDLMLRFGVDVGVDETLELEEGTVEDESFPVLP